jgi:hypothetical protein
MRQGRAGQGGKAEYEAFHKPDFQRIVILTKANTLSMGKYFSTGLPSWIFAGSLNRP